MLEMSPVAFISGVSSDESQYRNRFSTSGATKYVVLNSIIVQK